MDFNSDKYYEKLLTQKKIETKMDALLMIELLLFKIYDGSKCEKCGVIQGKAKKGFKKYYCEHFGNRIGKRFAKENKMVTEELFSTKFWEQKK